MHTTCSRKAAHRSQQLGVPPLIRTWLLDYGDESFDGHGGIVRHFTRRSLRRMECELGAAPLKRMHEYFRCYLVQSNADGSIITVGKLHHKQRVWRH